MEAIGQDLKRAVKAIKNGKILVCPTDTVYGLICDFNNKKAVERLYKIKKRQKTKPIPIFIKDIRTAKHLAKISPEQEEYLRKFWPGKVTFVLQKRKGRGTIGLRIPEHDFLFSLIEKTNRPLTGTSANIAGKPSSTKIKEVIMQFRNKKHRPDFIVDAGNLKINKPSKVIDLTVWPYKTLRY